MLNYLKESYQRNLNSVNDFYTSNGLHVYVKDPVSNGVDPEVVISKLESVLPPHLFSEVEMVAIGHFKEFEERKINAFYSDGCLYISNEQDNEADLIDDLIHEMSHSLEESYGYEIYGDKQLEEEFLQKRIRLYDELWAHGYKTPKSFFLDPEYDAEFDDYLLNKVGYNKLSMVALGIFISAYAATSLREYFATGFTYYYLNEDLVWLKMTCPILYSKIDKINKMKDQT